MRIPNRVQSSNWVHTCSGWDGEVALGPLTATHVPNRMRTLGGCDGLEFSL